ncbi:hypothetical protein GCM10009133_28690 [Cocleimonas flava]|jgi:hypothetical protein|uniref:Uncharacterized protein DUF1131 n=1 Tax=Cocleimonas flava TaxID=634765 RepID=A0A4R1FBE5_9GAMM|nr:MULTISPECIES: DUF1131 family protein [Cocleimonas]MEB8431606.1 DUF1131 family protein [Cocleimonas sp. KMM 6892]MEC4713622.1 DUF1131 family protein [Cocleimonas sp. KMM 6895]MEC4742953.1 DUF1131 family protein [Cocleimonas sp. KMM 6896]TCJ89288.1 uncharacterized protein DUF1131 [Cocleimonas flava]
MENAVLNVSKNTLSVFLFTLILSLGLTACDNDDAKQDTTAAVEDKTIILSADGIGPINATTSFNMHQMTLAFSDYSVVEEVNFQDGNPFPAIRISEGVKTILNIIPDAAHKNIYSVIIEDNIIQNSLGHHLGTLYNKVYTYGQNEQCQAGYSDMSGKVLCYAPNTPNILYVFNGKWDNPVTGKIPPADVLQGWSLESIIWRPKS